MDQNNRLFVGLDVSKLKISVAIADGERGCEVRFYGDIASDPTSVANIMEKLGKRGAVLHFCYEAGPTGYELRVAERDIIHMSLPFGPRSPRRAAVVPDLADPLFVSIGMPGPPTFDPRPSRLCR